MANSPHVAGQDAKQKLGWLYSHRFLFLRRVTQSLVLCFFLTGPLLGMWVLKGNYSSSRFLDTVPLTDPLMMLESLLSGYWPEMTALLGAVIIISFYGFFGGKLFCSWVCPFNPVTDLAAWLRRKLRIQSDINLPSVLRYIILAAVLLSCIVSGVLVWEWFNPVSVLGRGVTGLAWEYGRGVLLGQALLIGFGWGIWLLLAIFLLDLFAFKHGWCGHICPMGALYGLIGSKSVLHIDAQNRKACSKCMDCINVCPEPQVLNKPLFGKQLSTVITSKECLRCGRCIDVCSERVFSIKLQFVKRRVEK